MLYSEFNNKMKIAKDKEATAKKHIRRTYVPYSEKLAEAKKIAEISTHTVINDKAVYKKNTPIQYFLKITRLISLYTDIELTEDINKAYDSLAESKNLDLLISQIPESEITQFTTMVEMCVSDIYENERDLSSFIETKIEAFGLSLNQMVDSLKETIENVDMEQVKNVISKTPVDDEKEVTDNT